METSHSIRAGLPDRGATRGARIPSLRNRGSAAGKTGRAIHARLRPSGWPIHTDPFHSDRADRPSVPRAGAVTRASGA